MPREDVDTYITRLQAQSATYQPLDVERPVQEKDCVRIDWECLLDGNRIDAESRQDVDIELGVGAIHEKLEQALIGMELGDTNLVDIEFPQDHGTPELAGKSTQYEITLHAITENNFRP